MRSRYTAYTRADIDYIANTLAPEMRGDFDHVAAKTWATQAKWLGLAIKFVDGGGRGDTEGVVAFVATYEQGGKTIGHHEVSRFRRSDAGEWLFVSGDPSDRVAVRRVGASPQATRRATRKVGRNDPCRCGSGRKYKLCCGR